MKINFPENLKRIRERRGLSKSELARRVEVSDVTIGYWENGTSEPKMGKVERLAAALDTTTDDLIFGSAIEKIPQNIVPLYGSISAGAPLEMVNVLEYLEIPNYIISKYPTSFLLKIFGDSMNKVIPAGAHALIAPGSQINNGEIAVVSIDSSEATLKRFYQLQNTIVLEPDSYNPNYSTHSFKAEEAFKIKILGKLVWYMAPFDSKF